MIKNFIEQKSFLRSVVKKVKLESISGSSIELNTITCPEKYKPLTSLDINPLESADIKNGKKVKSNIRIDILIDETLRVRFYYGERVSPNQTEMLISKPKFQKSINYSFRDKNNLVFKSLNLKDNESYNLSKNVNQNLAALVVETKRTQFKIQFEPFSISGNHKDGWCFEVGGREKNNFERWDSHNTGICESIDSDKKVVVENFSLDSQEGVYGFGEKFVKLNKVGQTLDLNMEDAFGVLSPRSYKNVPFFVSTKGYGVFFNHSSLMTFWVGSSSAADIQVAIDDEFLDYFIFMGSIKEILHKYTYYTGRGNLPPEWSFGYWQSKISYKSADETLEIVKRMRKENMPVDVVHLDTHWFKEDWYCDLEFDKKRFPDPKKYLKEMNELGVKVSLWQLPYIPIGSKLFESIKEVDGFVKTGSGDIYDIGLRFTPGFDGIVGIIDFTNKKAVKIYQNALDRLLKMGVSAFKVDFGESAPTDGKYFDGTPGKIMHNLYPLLYSKVVDDVVFRRKKYHLNWARSAWAGSQRYPLHWGGDNSPNFYNIIPQIVGGLSFGLSGFQFWSHDIGGFQGDTNDDLLIRWMQLGAFASHTRIHGIGKREIYSFSKKVQEASLKILRLRYSILPYILSSAQLCLEKSLPMMRALIIEFQNDLNVLNIEDQFLFGDSILVAPIHKVSEKGRKIYFPEGRWANWWNGENITGPVWKYISVDHTEIPLFIREGRIIPMCKPKNYIEKKYLRPEEVILNPFVRPGSTEMPLYPDGLIRYHFDGNSHKAIIQNTKKINLRAIGLESIDIEYV